MLSPIHLGLLAYNKLDTAACKCLDITSCNCPPDCWLDKVCETDQGKASGAADPGATQVTPEQGASGAVVLTVRQLAVRRGLALLLMSLLLAAGVLTNEMLLRFLQLT